MDAIPVYPTPTGNEKIWAILSHVSGFLGVPFILPLVIYLAMRGDSAYVTDNAREALNFHITCLILGLIFGLMTFILIGGPLLVILGVVALVLSILGAIKASEGSCYHYPFSLRLVK